MQKRRVCDLRHNELSDDITEMLQEVTNDVRIKPILQPLTGEEQSVGGNVSVEHELISAQEGFGVVDKGHFSI